MAQLSNAIKAIETKYNGYKFRSRTEARWAVYFDKLGIDYEYEPEGFDLGELGWYLPDFWLPSLGVWVEVKGKPFTDKEFFKLLSLTRGEKTRAASKALMLVGPPKVKPYYMITSAKRKYKIQPCMVAGMVAEDAINAVCCSRSARFENGQMWGFQQ